MQCQELRDLVRAVGIKLLERKSDGAVMGAASALEQAAIGGFLGQRMSKDVNRAFGFHALVDELQATQFAQMVFEGPRALPHGAQQAQRELPADHCCSLQKSL